MNTLSRMKVKGNGSELPPPRHSASKNDKDRLAPSLGDRVLKANSVLNSTDIEVNKTLSTEKRLGFMALVLFLSVVVVNIVIYSIVEFLLFDDEDDDWRKNETSSLSSWVNTSTSAIPPQQSQNQHYKDAVGSGLWKVTDTVPLSNLDDDEFQVYVGFVLWVTVSMAGLGLELLVWLTFLREQGWSKKTEARWKLAQFLFPLFGSLALGLALSQNFLSLLFTVLSMWKFGFPETLMYVFSALYDNETTLSGRITNFLNATGTVCHHTSAAMILCLLTIGVIPADRHIVSSSLVLVMQHWFVLLRYVNKFIYSALELTLEVWFEWVIISDLQHIRSLHWTASLAACGMLTAHWLYVVAAVIDLVLPPKLEIDMRSIDDTEEDKQYHGDKAKIPDIYPLSSTVNL